MAKLTLASLPASKDPQDDWREFYLKQGPEMLALAREALTATDKASIEKGLQIVASAFFEEDEENPDAERSLAALDFSPLVAPLEKLLDKKEFAKQAKYALWVCRQENASIAGGEKPSADSAFKDLYAKGETKVRKAVTTLWGVLKTGGDISGAIPYLVENQKKLAIFTDTPQVIAGYYLQTKNYTALNAWLSNADPQTVLRAYRGLWMAAQNGIGPDAFLKEPGVKAKVAAIAEDQGLPVLK